MEITLTRFFLNDAVTFGMLNIKGIDHWPIFTLENPWKDNRRNVSCIPEGRYDCSSYSSMKYVDVYKVHDVPARSGILFHKGNYERNTSGCILPGTGVDPAFYDPMVLHSGDAMKELRKIIKHQPFTLEIKRLEP